MRCKRRTFLAAVGAALLIGVQAAVPAPARAADALVVFAAASLKNALEDAAARWASETGKPKPKMSFAASNTLARQIEQGAPADIFFSADLDWMDYARGKKLIRPESQVNLLANSIVLIAPKDSGATVALRQGVDLAKALGDGRLAMGQVESVPAGKYGKAALEKLGAWNGVKDKVAQADSVRAALLLVSRGEAPLGIVYATDAAADPQVKVVASFPEASHPPIIYPVAMTKDSKNTDAAAFLDFLRGASARQAFEKQGFTVLNRQGGA